MRILFVFILGLFHCLSFSQAYKKVHFNAVMVDTHNDFLTEAVERGRVFDSDLKGETYSDLKRMHEGGLDVQIFSVFCDEHYGKGSAYAMANRELDTMFAIAARNPGKMQIVYNSAQLMQAVKAGKLAAMAGVEGGHMIEDDSTKLDSLFERGVRYMTLTWNNSTSWATSAADEKAQAFTVTPYGLTAYGKAIVKKMNRLGMMVDVSHVGEKTFWDVISTTTKPVIASHSSVYSICPVPRNLKDEQIKAIAKNGGVIQINFFSGFVDSSYLPKVSAFFKRHKQEYDSLSKAGQPEYMVSATLMRRYKTETDSFRPPFSLLIDHIDYIAKMVGPEYVGIGSDFDGIDSSPVGLDGVEDYPKITEALMKRGYKAEAVTRILGGNLLRVLKANEVR